MAEERKYAAEAAKAEPQSFQYVRPDLLQYASALTIAELDRIKRQCSVDPKPSLCEVNSVTRDHPELLLGKEEAQFLACADHVLLDCGSDLACKARLKSECLDGAVDPPELTFRAALEAQLRRTASLDAATMVVVPLVQRVNYSKTPAGPVTEFATEVKFDRSKWDQLFGTLASSTKLPPIVAGFIAEILEPNAQSAPTLKVSKVYVDRQATEAMFDPALASLREFFRDRADRSLVDAFQLRNIDDLFRLEAFFMFGNPLLRNRLMSSGMSNSRFLAPTSLDEGEYQRRRLLVVQGLTVYAERKEVDMFRFLVYLYTGLSSNGSGATPGVAAGSAAVSSQLTTALFLLFSSVAQAFSATGDERYLRLFFALQAPGWRNWGDAMGSMYKLPWQMPNLVRISRLYTLGNPLQSSFFEPKLDADPAATTTTNPEYLEQAKSPTIAQVLEQNHKKTIYAGAVQYA
jgi:hypothetical protein